MSYRNIKRSEYINSYKKCFICKMTYAVERLIGDVCIRCHYPYLSLAEFIRANPSNIN